MKTVDLAESVVRTKYDTPNICFLPRWESGLERGVEVSCVCAQVTHNHTHTHIDIPQVTRVDDHMIIYPVTLCYEQPDREKEWPPAPFGWGQRITREMREDGAACCT